MAYQSRRPPGRPPARASLTSGDVARAALITVERDGLDGLSMRRVADHLGVQAASLYWHVQSKEHLLDLMAEELFAILELPSLPAGGDWRTGLRDLATAYYQFLLSHRDAARIVAGRFALGIHFLHHLETFADLLKHGGFSDTDTAYALYAVIVYIQGFVLHQTSPLSGDSANGTANTDVLAGIRSQLMELPPDRFPATMALAESLTRPDIRRRFTFGLDLLLDGLDALSARRPRSPIAGESPP
ncbi:MAG TPA: TetR/AcrR family transcriptional regulator C-terminal domain-containing protein [Streptosporangiaceae bacterium]|nr:TetR/AcrR family transcriptional regulator C-terminal domain-containing protein [Streptosporangiaceae bacterium]